MGFSSALQGSASSEAILARQDAEIRLLETMRRCLALRVKADREYAVALGAFVIHAGGNKMDPVLEQTGSNVAKAWASFVDENERIAKCVKDSAELLAGSTLEKLNELYAEKKANRKQYHDEYQSIGLELHRLQESVAKTRADYEKCQEAFTQAKTRFEEACAKGKNARQLEPLKDKYMKSSRKLHLIHNEYVLLLCEASEYERDMRTILLPGLLEHQQAIQEDMVDKWKICLQEAQISLLCYTDPSKVNGSGGGSNSVVEAAISAIKSSEEYLPFIERHRTAPPPAITFRFELTPPTDSNLDPEGLTLDETTVEPLRIRLRDNEARLTECRARIQDRQTLIIQSEAELATVRFRSDPASVARMFSVKKRADFMKKEVNELRCLEQKLSRQNELMAAPLAALGGAPPPRAMCEAAAAAIVAAATGTTSTSLVSENNGNGIGMVNNLNDVGAIRGSQSQGSLSTIGGSAGTVAARARKSKVINLFKTMAPTSGSTSSVAALAGSAVGGSKGTRSGSLPSVTSEGPGMSQTATASGALDGQPEQSGSTGHGAVPADAVDGVVGGVAGEVSSPMTFEPGRPLDEELWFHGVLPRGEVVRLLEKDGDFLVRETVRNEEKQIVLSVMWTSPKHFIVQTSPEGLYRFEGPAFATVQELILHQFRSESPVTSRSGAILKNPILREKWELNNDDVELLDKIGRGNFGDVYRANLKPGNLPVAVKTCKTTLPEEQKKKFLQEGRILKQYDHPNVVRFIGICVQKQPIMIVMELVPGGSLLNFLRNSGMQLTQKNLLGMCLDAAAGMSYLESKNCIHRDLAARNCLVGKDNSVKISDFGMSREEEEYTVSDGLKQIPIKWTAPEALNYGKYTSLCDVWSYGVLCWEIFSKGGTPYQGMTNTRAREMLDSGYRMPSPEETPPEMYELMLRCWNYEPEDRPHFPEIHATVDILFSRELSILET